MSAIITVRAIRTIDGSKVSLVVQVMKRAICRRTLDEWKREASGNRDPCKTILVYSGALPLSFGWQNGTVRQELLDTPARVENALREVMGKPENSGFTLAKHHEPGDRAGQAAPRAGKGHRIRCSNGH